MTREAPAFDRARLYALGRGWLYRAHPLTKLALVPALTALAVAAGGYAAPSLLLAALILVAIGSGAGRLALGSLRLLLPIAVALLLIHLPFHPDNRTPIFTWGGIALYREGLDFALTTLARLAVFVAAVTLALRTTHPKALVTALVERGVSHRIGYAYLAGAELVPEMRQRAREILDAQRSRGFDTAGSPARRARTLFALLKPLLVGALISAETRSLALEARGFSLPGPRTSTVALADSGAQATLRWLALAATVAGLVRIALR